VPWLWPRAPLREAVHGALLESGERSGIPSTLLAAHGDGPARTEREDASDPPDGSGLPSAVPSLLEARARLASEAAAQGDFEQAKALIEKAAQVNRLVPREAG
jgi:hypothetical protein